MGLIIGLGNGGGGGGSTPTPASISTATLMQTGATTSYRTGDDADTSSEGRATDFFTLAELSPLGNYDRFTDELGTQTYADDIVIDWSTFNGSTVLGFYRISNGVNITWNNAIDNSLLFTKGTYTTGWRLPNIKELYSLVIMSSVRALNYTPFNINSNEFYWSSTTAHPSTVSAYNMQNANKHISASAKGASNGYRYLPCRTFTVTGTILT
jgi:hypothetical protein